jgi:hypothetical protein
MHCRVNEIWFDNVDEVLLDTPKSASIADDALVKTNSFEGLVILRVLK